VVEAHRDPHRDFRKLDKDDQKQYWTWRHSHPDRESRPRQALVRSPALSA
jgi:hypothetical protein